MGTDVSFILDKDISLWIAHVFMMVIHFTTEFFISIFFLNEDIWLL